MGEDAEKEKRIREFSDILRNLEDLAVQVKKIGSEDERLETSFMTFRDVVMGYFDNIIGTQDEHGKRLDSLELTVDTSEPKFSKFEERLGHLENLISSLEKELEKTEFRPISLVQKKIKEKKEITEYDLRGIDGILLNYTDNKFLWFLKSTVLYFLVWRQDKLEFQEEAKQFSDQATTKYPDDAELWIERGLFYSNDLDESLRSLDKGIKLTKKETHLHAAYHFRSAILKMHKKYEMALKNIDKSLGILSDCERAWGLKGSILLELRQTRKALGCYEKAIELDPNLSSAWNGKGIALSSLGPDFYQEAVKCWDIAIEKNPKNESPFFNKGILLIEMERFQDAIVELDKGLAIDAEYACAWCSKGLALGKMGRHKEALAMFEKAIELGSKDECLALLGRKASALQYLDNHKGALETYDTMVRKFGVEEWSTSRLNSYSFLLFEHTDRYGEGERIAREALEKEPDDPAILDTLACNLYSQGKDKEALETFERAINLKKDDHQITWKVLAKLYERLGKKKAAEKAYLKYKELKGKEKTKERNPK